MARPVLPIIATHDRRQVTGIRNDPYARENPYQVVREKTGDELGRYWYPEGYGQPHEMSISMIGEEPADEADFIDEREDRSSD